MGCIVIIKLKGVDSSFLLHAWCNVVQPRYHGMEIMDLVDKRTPISGDHVDIIT